MMIRLAMFVTAYFCFFPYHTYGDRTASVPSYKMQIERANTILVGRFKEKDGKVVFEVKKLLKGNIKGLREVLVAPESFFGEAVKEDTAEFINRAEQRGWWSEEVIILGRIFDKELAAMLRKHGRDTSINDKFASYYGVKSVWPYECEELIGLEFSEAVSKIEKELEKIGDIE